MTSPARLRRNRHKTTQHVRPPERPEVHPSSQSGFSGDLRRSDCVLIGKAGRARWSVPDQIVPDLVDRLGTAIDSSDERLRTSATTAAVSLIRSVAIQQIEKSENEPSKLVGDHKSSDEGGI